MRGRGGRRGAPRPRPEPSERINNQIDAKQVRVVHDERGMLGVMNVSEAIAIAEGEGVDLVEISPNADPPVCRIVDFGKYRFEKQKKAKEAKKKQKIIHVKEIKFRPKIDEHDFNFKVNHVKRFLADGDKVKVTIMFRGREMAHTEIGRDILDKVVETLGETITVEKEPKLEGRNMTMVVSPKGK